MNETTSLAIYQFTLDSAIAEWVQEKQKRTGSQRTRTAYTDTLFSFRSALQHAGLELLPVSADETTVLTWTRDAARLASLWAGLRSADTRAPGQEVSPATYNQRLAIVSSFYTYLHTTYHLQIPNPIAEVKKRPVQAYAGARALEPEEVESSLETIDRTEKEGLRDYAILAVAFYTGRRAQELVQLTWRDMQIIKAKNGMRIHLTFHCKGGKTMKNLLDVETSAVLLDYLHAEYGKQLLRLPAETPLWVSYSRRNRGECITARTLANICKKHLDTSKVHALRHTFAKLNMRAGASLTDLAQFLGHTDIKVTQRYATELMGEENPYGETVVKRLGIRRRSR